MKKTKNGLLLQNLLVENGLAENYMLQNNYKYAGMLQESEENAKNNKLGIWSEETSDTQNNESVISIFSIAHNKKKEK